MAPPVAIIAGSGQLPIEIAAALTKRGQDVYVIGIAGEVDKTLLQYPNVVLQWGQIGKLFKVLRENCILKIVLAGGILGRPEFKLFNLDLGAFLTLPRVLGSLLAGDNTLLSSVIAVFHKKGFEVCNVAEMVPDLVVQSGAITKAKPGRADLARIQSGAALTHALGPHDVGQACIVVGKRAVAVEGIEGTDAMLTRVADLRKIGRLPKKPGGVLVKAMKPGQDERADLPTIGPNTVENVHIAGLTGIGVQAGKTLIVERELTLQRAESLGIFIYGFDSEA